MIRRIAFPIIMVILLLVLPTIFIIAVKRDNRCDTEITMKNGIVYRVMRECHTNDGMTWVRLCDGSELSFPTVDIQTIKSIK